MSPAGSALGGRGEGLHHTQRAYVSSQTVSPIRTRERTNALHRVLLPNRGSTCVPAVATSEMCSPSRSGCVLHRRVCERTRGSVRGCRHNTRQSRPQRCLCCACIDCAVGDAEKTASDLRLCCDRRNRRPRRRARGKRRSTCGGGRSTRGGWWATRGGSVVRLDCLAGHEYHCWYVVS